MKQQLDSSTEVERAENEDGWKVVQRRQRRRSPRQERGILDLLQEGSCFRCLSQEHYARYCRYPIRCRLCRREGHRHTHCPLKLQGQDEKQEMYVKGLSSCLVGVMRGGCTPPLDQTILGLKNRSPNLTQANCHVLTSGDFFLRGLSREDWNALRGWKQQCIGHGAVCWRRPNLEDGSIPISMERCVLELRRIPF